MGMAVPFLDFSHDNCADLNLVVLFFFFNGMTEVFKLRLIMRGWCSCSYWTGFWKNTSTLLTSQWRRCWSHAAVFPAPPSVVVLLCLYRAGMRGMFWGSRQVTAVWFVKPAVAETKRVYIVNRGFPEAPRRASAAAAAVGRRDLPRRDRSDLLSRRSLLANGESSYPAA